MILTICAHKKKGSVIMNEMIERSPKWYKVLLIVSYALPVPALFLYTFFALVGQGIEVLLGGFFGSLIFGALFFFPFTCIYYAVLTFIQTLLDEIFFGSKKRILYILIAFVCSAFLCVSSVLTLLKFEDKFGWIYLILMIVGFLMTITFLFVRMVLSFVSYLKNKRKR